MAGRPRRTRMYDTAYNIGQSYYQPTLDRLDRKLYGKPEITAVRALSPRPPPKFSAVDDMFEDDLKTARRRAERAITEEGFLDIRNIKFPKPQIADSFDDEVSSTFNRARTSKQMLNDMENNFDETVLAVRRNRDYLTPTVGKSLKMKMVSSEEEQVGSKWCRKTEEDSSLESSSRARATKARLHDLESDMFDRSERQAARDRRMANVRQILADNHDVDEIAMKSMSLAEKHVSF